MSGSVSSSIYSTSPSSIYNTLYDPNAAMTTSAAATAPGVPTTPANALAPQASASAPAPQAPAISPMWGSWGGFGGTPSGYSSTNLNPFAGAVPASTNPGFMTFAQAQAQAALPGQNPFAGVDPSHPLWQVMFNQYTDMGQTDPRALFQQTGQPAGGGTG